MTKVKPLLFMVAILFVCSQLCLGGAETGPGGINSDVTGLDRSGVLIGMVERTRAAVAGYDSDNLASQNVAPAGVFLGSQNTMAGQDVGIVFMGDDDHATTVAEIMIGGDELGPGFRGVAPEANLYSSTISILDPGGTDSLNRMAQRTIAPPLAEAGRVRAINMSYYQELQPFTDTTDGNSLLTQFVDWSAAEHDVTYVVAWPNADANFPAAPSDNFNGITVAFSEPNLLGTVYDRIDSIVNASRFFASGFDAVGVRTSIDILDPGNFLDVNNPSTDMPKAVGGSSWATPHVTGAVALLQQIATEEIAAGNPAFDFFDSRRHQVMKAVILNSADKLAGVHGSTRSILDAMGRDWTQVTANNNDAIPLDIDIGAGHLNVQRAVEQYRGGEVDPGMIGDAGWDHGRSGGIGDRFTYALSGAVEAGEYISVTLAWDRVVDLINPDGTYTVGDQFFDYVDISEY